MDPETPDMIGTGEICLAHELGPRDAAGIRDRVLAALRGGGAIVVDTTEATGMHVAILQILLALARDAALAGRPFTLIAPPGGACATAFERAGLDLPGQARAA
ncbi:MULTISPECIES: STAS domain-containing protein [Rhodovulum]|uniref:STAS domain-containing protein n=3 Tax=Rhodovulum TaxID=34008 RepID=A0A4R8FJA7_9RHOB|nr:MULTISPECIES: STAS domain-containing protein [Rhodovulum]PTW45627.1 STAS domain-containing protein [Rhodovulum kholense]RAP40235.1 hypothetical protein BYZ73_16355 [Rhodovulum viride]TDX25392.1 STAS domain-containing protein [Rhodovulum visakhapatnamense]